MSRTVPMPPAHPHPITETPTTYLCLKQQDAVKLGQRADGLITYQILTDLARLDLFVRIVANQGSGAFSDEAVPVAKLVRCVVERDMSKGLRASIFQPAIRGRSSCNQGFVAAALLAEGLLGRDADKRHDLIDLGRWNAWATELMAIDGEPSQVTVGKAPEAKPPADIASSVAAGGTGETGENRTADVPAEDEHARTRRKPHKGKE